MIFDLKYYDKMNVKNIVCCLVLLFSILGCERKTTEFEFEKDVLTEIFPSLVDSICVDSRIMEPPPMLGEYFTDETGHVFRDSTKSTNEQKASYAKWKSKRNEAEKDTSKVIIAFNPVIKQNVHYFDKNLLKQYPILDFFLKGKDTVKSFVFYFDKIKLNNKFKLKNISEFPNTEKHNYLLFEQKYNFVFSGIFYVSRIQFDKEREKGLLEASFDYCGRCGSGYNVYIKNVNGVWVIDKLEVTWVS